jgi:hypothetical protein
VLDHSDLAARLWRDVKREGDGCWTWQKSRGQWGHGLFYFKGQYYYAHRVAYQTERGPIPVGHDVKQSCQDPSCCRPEHLYTRPHGGSHALMAAASHPWAGGLRGRNRP